ncbi:hypothetical protein [Azospirillum oleiclasticum]|uniref:Lipoprotein n=2 Tax=Azospirillum oleiclasticum TaxID=2735135 RepID=A0ABX2TEM3_9PROT|nr:hypothetical protein [Azospirillum oleiclasticum]NYZ22785.1 hypothetical protein [Azospirillum oleiclasticum]
MHDPKQISGEMQMFNRIIGTAFVLGAIALASCRTADYAADQLNDAEADVTAGRYTLALGKMNYYVTQQTPYGERARKTINSNEKLKATIPRYYKELLNSAYSIARLSEVGRQIPAMAQFGLIGKDAETELLRYADQYALESYRNGRYKVDLSHDISLYPSLQSPEIGSEIFLASLEKAKGDSAPDPYLVKSIFSVVANEGKNSPKSKLVLQSLPEMRISKAQMQEVVAPLFPEQARKILADRSVSVRLFVSPEDRLLYEDLSSKLRDISPNISLVSGSEQATVSIFVKKLQWEERQAPSMVQPVMYAQHEVDLLSAVLLMPKNATYIYDVSTGGVQINYAFEVKAAMKNEKPFDDLIRNKIVREWKICSNARIQNVFGGVQPASFVANSHMQQMCNGGSSAVSVDQLRDAAISEVVKTIRKIPVIDKAASIR